QIAVEDARIAEQKAVIKDLETRPKKEEIVVAQRALDGARKREKIRGERVRARDVPRKRDRFSGERVPRMERLYADRAISFEELDAARREHEVDLDEVAKRTAHPARGETRLCAAQHAR